MKTIAITFNLILFSLTVFPQRPIAPSCTENNCYLFTVAKSEWQNTCADRIIFTITNKTKEAKDIKLFVEGTDKKWYAQAYKNNLSPEQATTSDKCEATGRYVIYYMKAGDNKYRYPSIDEVIAIFGKKKYGYGDN
jgi:hypothetical protein